MTDNRTTELVSRREAKTLLEEFLCGYQNILLSPGINASEAVCKQNELIDEYAERIEQAIAATLGGGTCENEWVRFGKFRCSECCLQVDSISTNTTAPIPIKHCPNCGAKVVKR